MDRSPDIETDARLQLRDLNDELIATLSTESLSTVNATKYR